VLQRRDLFHAFWEAEVPRFGEPNAIGYVLEFHLISFLYSIFLYLYINHRFNAWYACVQRGQLDQICSFPPLPSFASIHDTEPLAGTPPSQDALIALHQHFLQAQAQYQQCQHAATQLAELHATIPHGSGGAAAQQVFIFLSIYYYFHFEGSFFLSIQARSRTQAEAFRAANSAGKVAAAAQIAWEAGRLQAWVFAFYSLHFLCFFSSLKTRVLAHLIPGGIRDVYIDTTISAHAQWTVASFATSRVECRPGRRRAAVLDYQ
jgi:hypothetical protein